MKTHFSTATKIGVLSIFWLVFPPLFLFFSIVWKMPKLVMRIVLTVVAPLTIAAILIGTFGMHQLHYFYIERGSRNEIETKTRLSFPDYETVEKRHFTYKPGFNGDFTMEYTMQLDTTNIRDFYRKIEERLQVNADTTSELSSTNYWSRTDKGNYSFTHFDMNDEDDQTLSLDFDNGKALVKVTFGRM